MEDTELQYYIKAGMYDVSNFYYKKIEEMRKQNKVPVIINNNKDITYWVDCDLYGMPKMRYIELIEFDNYFIKAINENDFKNINTDITVLRKCIMIESPLLYRQINSFSRNNSYMYFMWSGSIQEKEYIPIEKLNITEILKIVNKTIEQRSEIVINDVIKNKIIK